MIIGPFDIERAEKELEKAGKSSPTRDEIAMQFVRNLRTSHLRDSDWLAGSDVTMSDAWKKYRKDLRDLPANSTPSLDENNKLTGVNWPTKPA